ncbi:DUF3099 domain-containing protein [Streptomyces sp. NPDC047000]|uniref:DUF3099 domain-containing protein n=1 Tax=Streptomyces sp. NPDC047000 TaxID=3155474 RepID=UPI0033D277B7
MRKQQDGSVQVFRITGARTGLAEDVRGRQRRYIISMTVRTLSVILAVTLWNVERYVAVVALVLGAVLPYIAVVVANAGRERAPSLPSTFVTSPMRPMISSAAEDEHRQDSGPYARQRSGPHADARPEPGPEDRAGDHPKGTRAERPKGP